MQTSPSVPPSQTASPPERPVLVVESGAALPGVEAARAALEQAGLCPRTVADPEEAVADPEAPTPAFVVVLGNAAGGGVAAIERLRRRWPGLRVLLATDRPTVAEAVCAMQGGAAWYGGLTGGDLGRAIRAALESPWPRSADERGQAALEAAGGIVGRSEAMRRVLRASALVASTRTTVLLLGETGTGKERLAQVIHQASSRRRGPFVPVNCGALVETLLESELFGHEKGAFSGAHSRREGRFKMADGGTLFLDEIGELSLATQVKLLRVLQERKFERVGGNQTQAADVRIIAATNRNLRDMVATHSFRADLFYRLNVMAIELPPLRERREDIPPLCTHLLPRLAMELGLPEAELAPQAMAALVAHDWPGNVRELENVLQRALVLAQGRTITGFDGLERPAPPSYATSPPAGAPLVPGASFREIERHVIMATYEACGRSPLRTAEVLGISPRTIHYRLREYRGQTGRRRVPWDAPALGTGPSEGVTPWASRS